MPSSCRLPNPMRSKFKMAASISGERQGGAIDCSTKVSAMRASSENFDTAQNV